MTLLRRAAEISRPDPVMHYQREEAMRFDGNGDGSVNYEPNSR
jgi:hypothetical protein